MIIIGDSVSEGYEPVVAANLSARVFIQHSPWSVGGGADDVFNGLNCEEEFLRTAMYQPGASAPRDPRSAVLLSTLAPPRPPPASSSLLLLRCSTVAAHLVQLRPARL